MHAGSSHKTLSPPNVEFFPLFLVHFEYVYIKPNSPLVKPSVRNDITWSMLSAFLLAACIL